MRQMAERVGGDGIPISCTIRCSHCNASVGLSALSDHATLVWDPEWDEDTEPGTPPPDMN